jgi:predicted transcriptional regulator YheO
MLNEIQILIEEEELNKPCRNREKLFRRYFVIWFLRENKIPIMKIGKMIGKHHATVLHSLQQHELMMRPKTGDDNYKKITEDLRHRFMDKYFINEDNEGDLMQDVMMASSYYDLTIIKKRIEKGYYDIKKTYTFVGDRAANTVETDQKIRE